MVFYLFIIAIVLERIQKEKEKSYLSERTRRKLQHEVYKMQYIKSFGLLLGNALRH